MHGGQVVAAFTVLGLVLGMFLVVEVRITSRRASLPPPGPPKPDYAKIMALEIELGIIEDPGPSALQKALGEMTSSMWSMSQTLESAETFCRRQVEAQRALALGMALPTRQEHPEPFMGCKCGSCQVMKSEAWLNDFYGRK